MQLETSLLSFAFFAWLGHSQVITVVIDPDDSSKCAFLGEGLEGCGTLDDPAYSVAFGPLRNDNDCAPHLGDHNGTILGICGTHADGSWVGMITRKLGPYGEGDDLKSVGYVDDRSNGSPRLYCGCLMYGKHGHPGPSFDEFETCTLCYCEEKMGIGTDD